MYRPEMASGITFDTRTRQSKIFLFRTRFAKISNIVIKICNNKKKKLKYLIKKNQF